MKCLLSSVMCEQPLNSMIFSPCSYFFIIVNYWAVCVKYLSLCNTFATDWSHEIPRVLRVFASFCKALFANSQIFDKAELFISGLIASVQCQQSHGQILLGKNTSNLSQEFYIILLAQQDEVFQASMV